MLQNNNTPKFEIFGKSMMKIGFVVQTRNGNWYLCMPSNHLTMTQGEWVLARECGHMSAVSYDGSLLCDDSDYDIMRVFDPKSVVRLDPEYLANTSSTELLWERKEKPVEMTVAEIEKRLGIKNLHIVAEEEDDEDE